MSFDLHFIVDEMVMLALQNEKTLYEDMDLVIEGDKNQLDFPPQEIAQKSGSHPYFFTQICQSSDWFQLDGPDLLKSTSI